MTSSPYEQGRNGLVLLPLRLFAYSYFELNSPSYISFSL